MAAWNFLGLCWKSQNDEEYSVDVFRSGTRTLDALGRRVRGACVTDSLDGLKESVLHVSSRYSRITNSSGLTLKYEAQTALFKDPVRTAQ